VFPGETVGTAIKSKQGDTLGFIGVIRDISERQRVEEQARQHQAELAHMARLNTMGEMATGIAHELNQPLAAIANYAAASCKMLDSGNQNPEKLVAALTATQMQAERASAIIRRLRKFVKKQQPQKTLLNLNELIDNVLKFMEYDINKHRISVNLSLDPQLRQVFADVIQIEQVVVNLLRNSIEAMEPLSIDPREINIRTYLNQEAMVQTEIADTGPGIDTHTLFKVFEPFFTTKGSKGMGLGLSISRSIIEAHEGKLWAKSEAGSGAIFYFTLPAAK